MIQQRLVPVEPKFKRIENNLVRTPEYITEKLIELESFSGNVLEPCCGDGSISKVLENHGFVVESSDLVDYGYGEVKDLFNISKRYDNIITNPPFSLNIDMIEVLLELTKKKLALLWYVKNIGNIIESRRSMNLKNIYVFNRKIDWIETKINWLFAWYVWEKGYKNDILVRRIM